MVGLLAGTGLPWLRTRIISGIPELVIPPGRLSYIRHYPRSTTRFSSKNYQLFGGRSQSSDYSSTAKGRRDFSIHASSAVATPHSDSSEVRVRFAPSPTGNLHVGGARTALFNYLFARSRGGKFILRIEDTDLERSTKESEDALLRDLSWLGLYWDEGPDIGGNYGPYRQSERNSLYKHYAEQLLHSGHVYLCFCSNEELEEMKEIAKLKQLPPVYTGKWANATEEEIKEELARGTPYTYRFRVPKEGTVKINDLIRGEVSGLSSCISHDISFFYNEILCLQAQNANEEVRSNVKEPLTMT